MENNHSKWTNSPEMAMLNSYVKLPEDMGMYGTPITSNCTIIIIVKIIIIIIIIFIIPVCYMCECVNVLMYVRPICILIRTYTQVPQVTYKIACAFLLCFRVLCRAKISRDKRHTERESEREKERDNIYIYVYHRHIHTHTYIYIYI